MQPKTHYKKLINPDYLGEYEFDPGEEKQVTIKAVDIIGIVGAGGKKDDKPVMHFVEQVKPLILNSTNFKTLTKLFKSPYIEDWTGKQITLYGDPTVTFGKEVVGGVRIRKDLPLELVCSDCGQIVGASGKFTPAQIAQAARNRFGRVMCVDCVEQIKAREMEQVAAEQTAAGQEGQDGQQ